MIKFLDWNRLLTKYAISTCNEFLQTNRSKFLDLINPITGLKDILKSSVRQTKTRFRFSSDFAAGQLHPVNHLPWQGDLGKQNHDLIILCSSNQLISYTCTVTGVLIRRRWASTYSTTPKLIWYPDPINDDPSMQLSDTSLSPSCTRWPDPIDGKSMWACVGVSWIWVKLS
jgi:hypothetical protein